MLTRRELLAYLDRVERRLGRGSGRAGALSLYELLDIAPDASAEAVRTAFQTCAVRLHPDLYRRALSAGDHERLTSLYARVAEAYLVLRNPQTRASYDRKLAALRAADPSADEPRTRRLSGPMPVVSTPSPGVGQRAGGHPRGRRASTIPPADRAQVELLSPKAQRLYRLAMAALETGDPSSAVLNLRMAARSSPGSALLRRTLARALELLANKSTRSDE